MTSARLAQLRFLANFAAYHVPGAEEYRRSDADRAQVRNADAGDDMLELCDAVGAAMTADELRAAAILDARTTYAAFESMQTVELLRLQIAQQLDQAAAITPESIAFGGGRLALIAAVLRKRGVEERTTHDDQGARPRHA